ncbi:MAG: DNA methyltransferase [Gemmatimonadaceae bacterium]
MLTTRDAARLLAQTRGPGSLAPLVAALGLGTLHPLDVAQRRRFGLAFDSTRVRVAAGTGMLRVLCAEFSGGQAARERAAAVCRELTREAPELLWLLVARRAARGELIIAAPAPGGGAPIAALEVDPAAVRESDAETFAALAGCGETLDLMIHRRWRETLGRDALSRRFYRELEERVGVLAQTAEGGAPDRERRTIALLHVSRLLFLAFLEPRGWLAGEREFLRTHLERCTGGRGAHRRFLEPLFFGTLNTPSRHRAAAARAFGRVPFLNGGLFTRTAVERRWRSLRFTDDALGEVIGGLLARYRLTARETSAAWSDAAVDPEMLGRAFESLMHAETRRAQGAFYTPPPLIARLTRSAFDHLLAPRGVDAGMLEAARAGATLTPAVRAALRAALVGLRVLDPACGSGAFLVFALEELAALHGAAGDRRDVAARRRAVLASSIFGVDRDPTAVWLCQLRLWLSVVVDDTVEDPRELTPLPNLDRNVREGDALAGDGFADGEPVRDARVEGLRLRYSRASGARKRTLARALDREERQRAMQVVGQRVAQLSASRRELLAAARSPDLFQARRGLDHATRAALEACRAGVRRARSLLADLRSGGALPFSFVTHFPEAARAGGFSLVIGNPPWVRTHAIPAEMRDALRARFVTFRDAAWRAGAEAAAAGRGFAGQADLAALFTERAVRLTADSGCVALLLPAKLWIALAGGGVRALLTRQAPPLVLEEWSGATAGFEAAVYPSALIARRASGTAELTMTVHRGEQALSWEISRSALALDATVGAPWLILPPEVRAAFDLLTMAGVPLAASALGRPLLGVKSGCNAAFIVSPEEAARQMLETDRLRPLLRGEHVQPWGIAADAKSEALIWTHGALGEPLAALPPATRRWLVRWRRALELRTDGRHGPWWALFRTEAARADRPRVVWADIGRAPRALVLRAGDLTVPLNTCYVVRTRTEDDAHALAVLFNSPVGAAWLAAIAEPARGGYRRFLGWTTARFPVPLRWERARALLAPIGRAAAAGDVPDPWTLTTLALDAYGVRHTDLAPLLSWYAL